MSNSHCAFACSSLFPKTLFKHPDLRVISSCGRLTAYVRQPSRLFLVHLSLLIAFSASHHLWRLWGTRLDMLNYLNATAVNQVFQSVCCDFISCEVESSTVNVERLLATLAAPALYTSLIHCAFNSLCVHTYMCKLCSSFLYIVVVCMILHSFSFFWLLSRTNLRGLQSRSRLFWFCQFLDVNCVVNA